jgi:zinc transport system ATP-binding protein
VSAPVIELEGVSFAFDNRQPVLSDVTLAVAPLSFACMIGPNGGGKTTLLKLILGLLEPTAGRIRVLGTSPQRARHRIGYMSQHATLDRAFPVRVLDVVLMGRLGPRRAAGPFDRADVAAARSTLERVGLADFERRPFADLSGGQRQRVLLARALTSGPELLLLDEPASGLDQKVERDFFDLLQELNRTTTVVLVSHDLGFVQSFVRSVICVHGTVDVHPTNQLDGTTIRELYSGEVRVVRHDHHHPE